MPHSDELARCEHEIVLATFAVMTGRDALDSHPVAIQDALLYLTDWEAERDILLTEPPQPAMLRPTVPPFLTPADAIALLENLWTKYACSVCDAHGSACSHRAPALADFLGRIRAAATAGHDTYLDAELPQYLDEIAHRR